MNIVLFAVESFIYLLVIEFTTVSCGLKWPKKRQLQNNNVYIYLNSHHQTLDNNNQSRSVVSDDYLDLKKILNLIVVKSNVQNDQRSNDKSSTDEDQPPEQKYQFQDYYAIIVHNFNTLFRILSFIAFVLVMFALIGTFVMVLIFLNIKRKKSLSTTSLSLNNRNCNSFNRNSGLVTTKPIQNKFYTLLSDGADLNQDSY